MLYSKQYDWDGHLQQIVAAIRASKNAQTGITPNLLMLGRDVFQPLELILGTSKLSCEEGEVSQYIKELMETLNIAHDIARENRKATQERQKRTYDLYTNHKSYNIGDVV
jgi:uncharacterized coiled-coil DUF342 family protein